MRHVSGADSCMQCGEVTGPVVAAVHVAALLSYAGKKGRSLLQSPS